MSIEEFKNKYENMKNTDIYKSYCSILDSKDLALKKVLKEKQELIEYLKEKINEYTLPLQDKNAEALSYSLPIKGVYQEILNKIEKR